ncbi:serine/threonine protein phosphatase PP2A-associated protein [Lentinula detonsa]|uniref:Serine/threonine protein phosphatase PP2A-associated protein n=2 Tax=Lentinula TaxID=5352 RepID=A0A9W8NYI9_9AGAR|nr:serine/threonine protein phosphatase PP2A-associated protein [Lentinula detonsa]KAJ3789402.1 serine/threonine protein phosphatase PP2A-associated protein [Lentinula aff. detonsa]KAJ3983540.1 serine/threonine protein phosphatase PP2A-associated protein [Lentinula detonsa]
MTNPLPLPTLFARSLSAASKASNLPTIDAKTQDLLQSSLTDLQTLQSRIAGLSLFSPNEILEDIATRDLVYLLVPYVRAQVQDRVKAVEREERLASLTVAKNYLEHFLRYLDDYEIIPEDQIVLYDRKVSNPASRRELKIKQYQAEKDLRARIETIRKRRNQRIAMNSSDRPNDFDLISSLIPFNTDDEEAEEDSSSIDDILRETTLLLIRLFFAQAQTQLQNMDQELELLRSAPPPPPAPTTTPRQEDEDQRRKRKKNEETMWKLDAPTPKVGVSGPLLDEAGKPLQPFTILPSGAADRARFQAQVFGPDHNLPTMSVDEYLEIERQRGKFISGGGPASQNAPTSSEQLALDAEMDGTVEGEDKAEVKRTKDESWARFTDDNPRGAGNTMNRG